MNCMGISTFELQKKGCVISNRTPNKFFAYNNYVFNIN